MNWRSKSMVQSSNRSVDSYNHSAQFRFNSVWMQICICILFHLMIILVCFPWSVSPLLLFIVSSFLFVFNFLQIQYSQTEEWYFGDASIIDQRWINLWIFATNSERKKSKSLLPSYVTANAYNSTLKTIQFVHLDDPMENFPFFFHSF